MRVKDVMTKGVECARPDDSLAQTASRMRDLNIGALPVCGNEDKLVGMITDRDITVRATAESCPPGETKVEHCMTERIIYCFEDQDISEAANLMEERQVRRVAVLNQNKRLVGIVSLGDLAVKGDGHLSEEALERVSEPAAPAR
jgi:CBS domain-containing protein